ncbi:MAG: DMT family transporter [Austwickia sp.]|nr:DMT family transporter [Austwickia sp.]MBK8437559.1 DMT family transporter [Austwickia sp.]MBK9102825.1 DMT family transporter [Austwickia sp.]
MRGYLYLALSATGFGFMPYFAVEAYRAGLTVPTLLFFRFALAAVLLFGYAAARRSLSRPRPADLALTFALGGIGYALMSSFYFTAVQFISPSLTTLLLYLYPALVAAGSAVLARARLGGRIALALLLTFAGTALAAGPIGGAQAFGVICGLAAAVTYSCYILLGDRVPTTLSPLVLSAYVCAFAAITLGAHGLARGELHLQLPTAAWPSVLLVAMVSTVLAVALFFAGLPLVGATRAAIVSTLEPAVNVAAGAWVYGQTISAPQLVGTVLVLAGACLGVLAGRPLHEPARRSEPAL